MKCMSTEVSCGKVTWKTRKHNPCASQDIVGKTQLTFYNVVLVLSMHCTETIQKLTFYNLSRHH
jgi:hypothetical protein